MLLFIAGFFLLVYVFLWALFKLKLDKPLAILASRLEGLAQQASSAKDDQHKYFHLFKQEWQSQAKNQQDLLLNQLSSAHQTHIKQYQSTMEYLHDSTLKMNQQLHTLSEQLKHELNEYRQQFDQHQLNALQTLQESLSQGLHSLSHRLNETLTLNSEMLGKRV